jgi:hypothetical protein
MERTVCRHDGAPRLSRRAVLAATTALIVGIAWSVPASAAAAQKQPPATMLPITINSVTLDNGQLTAHGTIGTAPFTAPVTLAPSALPAVGGTPILHLMLGPIHLNLLGLVVDTSEICLDVTANPNGGLLGQLLSQLLSNGLNLGNLVPADLQNLLNGLAGLLNGALGAVTSPATPGQSTTVTGTQAGACDILDLSLGPVDLNLLGLDVKLNNCANPAGPVTVMVTAVPGNGNLLGNLLCNLSNLLNGPANGNAIANALNRVADAILQLVNAA